MLKKVICGFQSGGDIAGARAAKACGLETGGYMTQKFMTTQGPKPEYAEEFGAFALDTDEYRDRTRKNVLMSDATFFLGKYSRGFVATQTAADYFKREMRAIPCAGLEGELGRANDVYANARWIVKEGFQTINIAGNRDLHEGRAQQFCEDVFRAVQAYERLAVLTPHFDRLFAQPRPFGDDCAIFVLSRDAYPTRESALETFRAAHLSHDIDESYVTDIRCIIPGYVTHKGEDSADLEQWTVRVLAGFVDQVPPYFAPIDSPAVWVYDPTNFYGVHPCD